MKQTQFCVWNKAEAYKYTNVQIDSVEEKDNIYNLQQVCVLYYSQIVAINYSSTLTISLCKISLNKQKLNHTNVTMLQA